MQIARRFWRFSVGLYFQWRDRHGEPLPLVPDLEDALLDLRRRACEATATASWTPSRLCAETQRLFGDSQLCVIANREPYIHERRGNKIEVRFPASGLVTAVEPAVKACAGLWIGHGSGSADRETADANGVLLVPSENPEYALKRVWLSKEEEQGYYHGFANEGLWPLCHVAHERPTFRTSDWNQYRKVNQKFARAFFDEMKSPRPIALIQDYHFALLPEILRRVRPDTLSSLFWHIPWPSPELFRICPWKQELLRGMLGADLIGFHIPYHCRNFLDSVEQGLDARIDRENSSVIFEGHTCYVKSFPVSVEWPSRHDVPADQIPAIRRERLADLGLGSHIQIVLGVDRLDSTKGVQEGLLAFERLLETHPELLGKVVFLQLSAPSRSHLATYRHLESDLRARVDRINSRFRTACGGEPPVRLRVAPHDAAEMFRSYRAADVCLVTSLHDGMNLVAKEYVSSRSDCGGSLVLSSFSGAAAELRDALIVNPYDVDETASAIYDGLSMSAEERRLRMTRLRERVSSRNVYAWGARILGEIKRISETGGLARAAS